MLAGVRATLRLSSVALVRAISSSSGVDWIDISFTHGTWKPTCVSATPRIATLASLRARPSRLALAWKQIWFFFDIF